mmetsp:Transcript_12179/g.16846  ORF Transcript_12179/g.16846 Transcript_12179/m.16846 type:complete len:276 (-) Transcript_12179:112-939(-)
MEVETMATNHDEKSLDGGIFAALAAGMIAGGLHAITGPDHMAALLPLCMGKPWYVSGRVGGLWGLGHGLGASMMGGIAFTMKSSFDILSLSDFLEAGVGVTLILIGLYGLKETREHYKYRNKKHDDIEMSALPSQNAGSSSSGHGHSHDEYDAHMSRTYQLGPRAVIATGIFHGFSGTGHLMGVIPALMQPSWQTAGVYLLAFCLGTTIAMSLFTGSVGQVSVTLRQQLDVPDLPVRLSMFSSIIAILGGLVLIFSSFWQAKSLVQLRTVKEIPP